MVLEETVLKGKNIMQPDFFVSHRVSKRQDLLDAGIDPYPYSFRSTHSIAEMARDFQVLVAKGSEVSIVGRVLATREMGKAAFIDVTNDGATFQVYLRIQEVPEAARLLELLDIGDWVGVEGSLFSTRTQQPSIHLRSLTLLSKAVADIPFGKIHGGTVSYGLADVEIRRQQRYLDWITNPESLERLKLRSKIISSIRRYLEDDGFLEVQTPTLEPVYGGAEARPFTTDVWALKRKMYLRVSPELYLKRYIVGGLPRVFSICQNFRNEGIDATHNPEFTMLEWYEAFTDYEDQMRRFESLTCFLVQSIHGRLKIQYKGRKVDFTPPWPRLRVPEILEEIFGVSIEQIDKSLLVEKSMSRTSDSDLIEKGMRRDELNAELNASSIGQLVMEELENFLRAQNQLWHPCFLCDHPKDISPLTKAKRCHPQFAERFEPYIAGMEVGNAYSELTDPVEQLARFMAQREQQEGSAKGYEDHPLDWDFLHAISCGMPPTGGVGFGVDRVIMILLDQSSIRDITPFPMSRS
jgi:lysyl-tRNA synthetase, class II